MCADKKEIQKKLDRIETKFDKNYDTHRKLEREQVRLVKKLEESK